MSDEAPESTTEGTATPEGESQNAETEDLATIKRRLSGKDQALTRTQRERDEAKAEANRLQAKLLEYEQANMTEAQRLQVERDQAKADAAAARAEANRLRLAQKYPLAVGSWSEDDALPSESTLAALEKRMKADEETERTPRIDPNQPRRSPVVPAKPRTNDEIERQLRDHVGVLLGES